MIDLAQMLQTPVVMVPNAKYTTAAGIIAAAVAVDTKDYRHGGRALIAILNEATTALTTLDIQHSSDDSSYATLDASILTNEKTGAAKALGNLNANTFQIVAIDLNQVKRYLKITATTNPTTSNGAAITVLFLGVVRETLAS